MRDDVMSGAEGGAGKFNKIIFENNGFIIINIKIIFFMLCR